jgi:hypothetical protein
VADTNEQPLICAECCRAPREDENAADEWRAYRDISDELPVFCPECAERESPTGSSAQEGAESGGRPSASAYVTMNKVLSVPAPPQETTIGQRPGVVRVPTFHDQEIRPPRFG